MARPHNRPVSNAGARGIPLGVGMVVRRRRLAQARLSRTSPCRQTKTGLEGGCPTFVTASCETLDKASERTTKQVSVRHMGEFAGRDLRSVVSQLAGRQLTEAELNEALSLWEGEYPSPVMSPPEGSPVRMLILGQRLGIERSRLIEGYGFPRFAEVVRRADARNT